MTTSIIDALQQLRLAFLRENLKPPIAVVLASRDEAVRLAASAADILIAEDNTQKAATQHLCQFDYQMMGIGVGWPVSACQYPFQATRITVNTGMSNSLSSSCFQATRITVNQKKIALNR